jgi:hypothetical protein
MLLLEGFVNVESNSQLRITESKMFADWFEIRKT